MHASIVGLEKSRKIAAQLTNRAFAALKIFKGKAGSVGSARGVSVEAGSLTKLSNAFVITCYRTSMQNVPFKLLDVWA